MQVIAAYLLTREDLPDEFMKAHVGAVRESLRQWLLEKGAVDPDSAAGVFKSKSNDPTGRFTRTDWSVSAASLERVRLAERTNTGQIFTTTIDVAARDGRVDVYCTLSVANSEAVIAPLPKDAHCPRIVRDLLDRHPGWTVQGYPIPKPEAELLSGKDGAHELAKAIRSPFRSLPIVVISEDDEGNVIWPYVDEYVAYDLAGVARVVRIDDEATWALSDEIGKLHSCYDGAIRLYWPPQQDGKGHSSFSSTVWTPSSLAASDRQGKGQARLRRTLRRIILSTAAIALSPPRSISLVQEEVVRATLEKMKATPDAEGAEVVRLYSEENRQLKEENERLESQLSQTSAHLRAVQYALAVKGTQADEEEDEEEVQAGDREPIEGEIRFYKKTGSRGAYDRLIQVNDCGHNNWEGANKADKAWNGLKQLTRRDDWDNMWHCASCTGGGMWKVRW